MWNDHWSVIKPAYFIIWFSFNINFRFSMKWYSRAQKVIYHKYVKYTCSMETVQQNGRFTLFSSKFPSNIFSILYGIITRLVDPWMVQGKDKPKLRLFRVSHKEWDFRDDCTELYSVFDLTFYVSTTCLYNCVFFSTTKNPYLRKNFNFQRVLYWSSSFKYFSLWVTL